jgi:methionyl-tRNA synthetase
MLMALELPLPDTVFAHGWWTVDGEKMSKSRGNVVDPQSMVDRYGADAFRYFVLREVPFGQDGDFSEQAMVTTINNDLANGIGNLLSRTLTMIERFSAGSVPPTGTPTMPALEEQIDHEARALPDRVEAGFTHLQFRDNVQRMLTLVGLCDEYIDKAAPWQLAKKPEDLPRLQTVLNTTARALRLLSVLLYPYIPRAADQMAKQLGLSFDFAKPLSSDTYAWTVPFADVKIRKTTALFPRVELTTQGATHVSEMPTPSEATAPTVPTAGQATGPQMSTAPQITIDEFMKIQLKTAKVLSAERVPKSEKLLKLQVSIGSEQRQIVAGIGKRYEPESLVGKTIVIVANLKPAKLMGIESQGMVLAAGDSEVRGLATFLEDVEPGTKVK